MKKFRSGLMKTYRGITYISLVATLFAMMVSVIDIILKLTVNVRIMGNTEMVELSMIIMMYLSFGMTQLENGHVRVDMFVNKFPPKVRCIMNGCVQLVCAVFGVMLAIQSFKQIGVNMSAGTASQVLHISYAPFSAIMAVGFVLYTIAIVLTALEQFAEVPHAQKIER